MAIAPQPVTIEPSWQRRVSLDEYHRMIDARVFDEDDRLELLEGVIVAMSPQGVPHARAITRLGRRAFQATEDTPFEVRVQLPLTLARSEPEPDIAIADPRRPTPKGRHPETALLVVEVASDSLDKDLGAKAMIYAEAAIAEYWVVNLEKRWVDVFTDPEAATRTYRSSRRAGPGETIECSVLAAMRVAVADLF
jgi:Uma2 family endonuclease